MKFACVVGLKIKHMIYAILIMLLWAGLYFFKKSFSNYRLYSKLKHKEEFSTDEKLWMYCYLQNIEVVKISGKYYVKRGKEYLDNGRGAMWWWTSSYLPEAAHKSIEEVLKTLEFRFSLKGNSVVMSKDTPPKQNGEEYLTLKQLVEEETDPKEKELLNRILERLNK